MGLTVSFTHLFMRTSSFQPFVLSTASCGVAGFVSHSGAYSEQNSTQPIGARAWPPTAMNSGRSLPAFAAGAASAPASAATATAAPNICAGLHFMAWPPWLFLWDHISHKQFQAALSSHRLFEAN